MNIVAPPWLHPSALAEILNLETETYQSSFTPAARLTTRQRQQTKGLQEDTAPPFLPLSTADQDNGDKLPYHWLEMGELLLDAASDDIEDPDQVRRLMRDLREVRMAKLRAGIEVLDAGGGVKMNGVGGMEVAEGRQFIGGVIDGLRYVVLRRSTWSCGGCVLTIVHLDVYMLRENRLVANGMKKEGAMDSRDLRLMMTTTTCYEEPPA